MKNLQLYLIFLVIFSLSTNGLKAQTNDNSDQYDFWVGKWKVSWKTSNGSIETGKNLVEKTLDGKVIQENFEILEGKSKDFKGTSLSVYYPQNDTWKQAWADNNGGFFEFTGKFEDDKRIFITKPKTLNNGNTLIQRMVFHSIKENSFTWDWEASTDGGKTWKLNWQIFYERL